MEAKENSLQCMSDRELRLAEDWIASARQAQVGGRSSSQL